MPDGKGEHVARITSALSVKAVVAGAERREIPVTNATGLYLVVYPSGQKSWAFRYRRPNGRPAKFTIGPEELFGLADARKKASDAWRVVREGGDPGFNKKEARRKAVDQSDLAEVLLDSFYERHVLVKNKPRTAAEVKRAIEKRIKPAWKGRKVGSLTTSDVLDVLEKIIDAGTLITANRVFAVVRKFFNWLVSRRTIAVSPVNGLAPPAEEQSRDRVLTEAEIRWIWRATEGTAPLAAMTRLLLLTGQRRAEVSGMRSDELDLTQSDPKWTIPGQRTKNGLEHIVPLSPLAARLVRQHHTKKCDFVLTSTDTTPVSGFSRFKRALDRKMLKESRRDSVTGTIPVWRLHDLRRTVATRMIDDVGILPHVVEAVLNHISGHKAGVAGVYNRALYATEKRQALNAWASYIEQLVTGRADNVVPFRAA